MTRYTFTILEDQRAALERSLLRDGREYGGLLLCGRSRQRDPWTGEVEERFLTHDVIEVEESAFTERSAHKMTWSTTPFYHALKRAEPRDLAVAVVHSHPAGPLQFSDADDKADAETFQIAVDRLESERPHLAIVMSCTGALIARAYERDLKPKSIDFIRVIGNRWRFHGEDHEADRADAVFDRQARAFGANTTACLGRLRIGIVGCGGTGSAIAALLARIGVRRMALFDPDRVDETTLNRMHFSTRADANLSRRKVDVVGGRIAELGLPVSVRRFPHHIDHTECRDALRSCDVLFGCTDDNLGRNLLNRVAHFYIIPVIDVGLLIDPSAGGGYDTFDGRVTVVQPGYPCQHCRKLIDPDLMMAEGLRRNDPVLYRERRAAGYVVDVLHPSPAVVTFTTEIAAMAVNELFQRLIGFRGPDGSVAERVRRFDTIKDPDLIPAGKREASCKVCGRHAYNGRGDMLPFLDQT